MRAGQTSIVVFISELVAAALGFVATIYFARILGAEVLGFYALTLALYRWCKLGGRLGVSSAVTKRISEGSEQSAYFTAGLITVGTFAVGVSLGILVFRDYVNSYVGEEVAPLLIAILLIGLSYSYINATLIGQRLVHISGVLSPLRTGGRSIIQIVLVSIGYGLIGMLVGYFLGLLIVSFFGILYISIKLKYPTRYHFYSLYDYAKYSWLSGLESRSFNDIDIIVLGAIVSPTLVGIYSVAWSIAKFLTIFGNAVRTTLFPEISKANAEENEDLVSTLVTDSITYSGLIAIPGLFGGIILGERLLVIYGSEFTQGVTVLGLLILATLIHSYQEQLINGLNAIDRPDIPFTINIVFIVSNIVLNIVLVLWIGWVGAAIATVASTTIGLLLSFWFLRQLVHFEVPIEEISRQLGAALLMTTVVWYIHYFLTSFQVLQHNALAVISLVILGAITYFITMLSISSNFRSKVSENTPYEIPDLFIY